MKNKEKKVIEYYGIIADLVLYNYSNKSCYTQKELYLNQKQLRKRFKNRYDAEKFFNEIKLTSK